MSYTAVDRLRYRSQQYALLASTSVFQSVSGLFLSPPDVPNKRALLKILWGRYRALAKVDEANVENGLYSKKTLHAVPWKRYGKFIPTFLKDFPKTTARRKAKNFKDLDAALPDGGDDFPAYYRRNFHWQTDGYFSTHSAQMYDLSVELLFLGTADAMRRQVLPPLVEHAASHAATPPATDQAGSAYRVLDVACGTGRTLEILKQALPASARLEGIDLSPAYVAHARTCVPSVTFSTGNAEAIDAPDNSYDATTCVFSFHEWPRRVRRQVMSELFRVTRPGGVVVIEDSAQRSESEEILPTLKQFTESFHEPYFMDYVEDPLEDIMTQAGFQLDSCRPHFISKVVVGKVPMSSS